MASTRSVIRAAAHRLATPGQVLERVNDLICPDMPPNMFATCLYCILEPETGRISYANAGHNVPYMHTATGVTELFGRGMPLGLLPGMTYEEKEVTLQPGESVLFHSDGLVEAHSAEGEMFGFPRLKDLVDKYEARPELIERLRRELASFTGREREQEDDVTLVTLARAVSLGQGKSTPEKLLDEFAIASEPGNERLAIDRVAQAVEGIGLGSRLEQIKTAVGEATMNAMEHGNKYGPELPVLIRVIASPGRLIIAITDSGGEQAIPTPPTPDLDAKLAGMQTPRGWGLFLIQNMVDDLRTSSDGLRHTIELIFDLEGANNA
jgi:anti-sigma regulatory factor (Ser/Thr protein kinase)